MKRIAVVLCLLATTAAAATINNDDSCDIALLPAATLLLPYFEVDFNSKATVAQTTLVTIQNTTAAPQIARVTLWTDWAYPMLTFNVFLTGYDVQGINLYDVFARGVVASAAGGAPGMLSLPNDQNPHFLADAAATCSSLPGPLDRALLTDLQTAFTKGTVTRPDCTIVKPVGAVHVNAIGYATIDVVGNCNPISPADPAYFTREILFDNVLTGDYQHVNPNQATGNYAGGNPLVHIRALPEGGPAGAVVPTRLPYTFYDLYTRRAVTRTQDRRQPLPSAFMPRFIQGGTGAFNTNYQIWREAAAELTSCPVDHAQNAHMEIEEEVRFDEHENPQYDDYFCIGYSSCYAGLPATSAVSTAGSPFPSTSTSGDVGGWMYLNLNNGGSPAYSAARDYRVGTTDKGPRQSQAWVVVSMFAEGRYATETDAAAIGNGCSPAPDYSKTMPIGPAPNAAPAARPGTAKTLRPMTIDNDDSCDIAVLPAATLLLPYFEVDFNTPQVVARQTLFTIQNTTAMPQIARVTLWTDGAYPMLTFNIFLTGYDVQGINLYDIFVRGLVAPGPYQPFVGGTSNKTPPGEISLANDKNPHFLPDAATTCSSLPGALGEALRNDLRTAFTKGTVTAPGCAIVKSVGGVHQNAVGYATIDVVANCNSNSPLSSAYFANEILFDNVLTGDYQHINPNPATGNYAGGNPLVHIRAIPEGGPAGAYVPTQLPYTFYDLFTTGLRRTTDRRQPLPSAFLPRFIEGGTGGFNTNLEIWREAYAAPTTCPLGYDRNLDVNVAEEIRFDEHENAAFATIGGFSMLPAVSSNPTTSRLFPAFGVSGDVGGWLYLNLNNGGSPAYSATRGYDFGTTTNGPRQSQAWVVTSMYAEGRFAVEMDAVAVGNGCSPAPELSRLTPIGPAANPNP